jgi:hypothetical protein
LSGVSANTGVAARWFAITNGAAEPTLPAEGLTQFVAVTREGLRGAVAAEKELGEGEHALSPLFDSGHDVITQIRLVQGS